MHCLGFSEVLSKVGCFLDPYEAMAPPSTKRSWKKDGKAKLPTGAFGPAQTSTSALTELIGVGHEIE